MRSLIKSATSMIRRPDGLQVPSSLAGYGRRPASLLTWGGVLVVAFILCYAAVLKALVGQWWNNDVYSYGFLIPCISLYLVWTRRQELRQMAPSRNYTAGTALVAAGLLMLILGRAAAVMAVQELSLIVTLAGVVLFTLGSAYFKALRLPIGYLFLMIPIWEIFTDRLHLPFQIFSATIGVSLLQFLGFPAHQQGVFVELPTVTLEVAQVCSGVNYLIAVVAIGIPSAYLFLRGWVSRLFLVGMTVGIAILSNGFRVALIGILVHYGANGDIHGPFHILQGMFVSVVGYVALFGGVLVLSRIQKKQMDSEKTPPPYSPALPSAEGTRSGRAVVILSLVFLAIASYLHLHRSAPVPLRKDLSDFPIVIGAWTAYDTASGIPLRNEDEEKKILSRTYRSPSGETVHLYVEYLASQEQGSELINYKSDALFKESVEVPVKLDSRRQVRVNRRIHREGEQTKVMLFWYDFNGTTIADRYGAKLHAMWEAVAFGRTNGAMIRISAGLPSGEGPERATSIAEHFIREVSPELSEYLPGSVQS